MRTYLLIFALLLSAIPSHSAVPSALPFRPRLAKEQKEPIQPKPQVRSAQSAVIAWAHSMAMFADVVVNEGGNLQTAISTTANCGDTITLTANTSGHQTVFEGNYTLPNKSCSISTPITIRSSELSSLPTGRVATADAAHMPKIRTANSTAVFTSATNAGWWVLDGLEITDNAGEVTVPNLIDYGSNAGAHDVTIKRLYMHQKETGTDTTESGIGYHRSVIRAVQFEGTNILYKWCYVGPFLGYYYTSEHVGSPPYTHTTRETSAFLSVSGSGISIIDNYLNAWWNTVFLGGADTGAQNTANLTSATTTSATFSNTTGLTAGIVIRFELHGTGTVNRTGATTACAGLGAWPGPIDSGTSSATLTRTSGVALTNADAHTIGFMTNAGDSTSGRWGMCSASGDVYTYADVTSGVASNGTVSWVLYQAAVVTSVVGSTVNYTPTGSTPLSSNGATTASWNFGDQGLISDILIQRNTFVKDDAFAQSALANSNASPKGIYEIKCANRLTVEGNYFLGYPSLIAHYPSNQYGTAPWTTVRDVIIRNNWMELTTGQASSSREAISITSQNDYATITPMKNVEIYNNLIFGGASSFISGKAVVNRYEIYHNTVLAPEQGTFAYHDVVTIFEVFPTYLFRDNIVTLNGAGVNCLLGSSPTPCFPSGSTWGTNVAINTSNVSVDDLGLANYTLMGSRINPVAPTTADVGFTNLAGHVFSLAPSSLYFHTGSGGSDPGVNWPALLAALPSGAAGSTTVNGKVTLSGKVTSH